MRALRGPGRFRLLLTAIVLLAILLSGCGTPSRTAPPASSSNPPASPSTQGAQTPPASSGSSAASVSTPASSGSSPAANQKLEVHFVDVGQADSILVQLGDANMLIDAGNNADADTVVSYLKTHGVTKLDYAVGTHPHEDHVGGLDYVIQSFDIGALYMPKATTTTKTFEDVLTAIRDKGLKITTPTPGTKFSLGQAECEILAPRGNSYDDLNEYSVIIRLTYGQTSFLFAGDAGSVSEGQLLSAGADLKADVLKVGHHGSTSATTAAFLKAVDPSYAVISVGKGNDYGHPAKSTMDRLKAASIPVYRTDESGTIIATSDGSKVTFSCSPGTYTSGAPPSTSSGTSGGSGSTGGGTVVVPTPPPANDPIVYITKTGEKYHSAGCSSLSKSCIPIKLSEAKAKGYTPCSKCDPPR